MNPGLQLTILWNDGFRRGLISGHINYNQNYDNRVHKAFTLAEAGTEQ